MSWLSLPPVWRPVPAASGTVGAGRDALSRHCGGEQVTLFESGTQALSAAIRESVGARDPLACNVVLPAYGCPDLVTACIAAGVTPRLVDVAGQFVGYDMERLAAAVDDWTVAIVAVNLLGAGDDAGRIAALARETGVHLIQDWAQSLPRSPVRKAGSHLVLSFGRGKPLNLLGGGAVVGPVAGDFPEGNTWGWRLRSSRLAVMAFGYLSRPAVYGLMEKLIPGAVGTTVYKPPQTPRALPEDAPCRLGPALPAYLQSPSYRIDPYRPYMPAWREKGIEPLSPAVSDSAAEPLRLPLLASSRSQRDRIVHMLRSRGLGASAMYGVPLSQVKGIPPQVARQGPFANAAQLAGRLFTLPTHARVQGRHAAAVDEVIRKV